MRFSILVSFMALFWAQSAIAQDEAARKFGNRESIQSITISPDGKRVAYIEPGKGTASNLFVVAIDGGTPKQILASDGTPSRLSWCDWANNDRLVCQLYGLVSDGSQLLGFTRMLALNADGSVVKSLGQRTSERSLGNRQFDGDLLGWNRDGDGRVLLSRLYLEEVTINTRLANTRKGLGVDRIDTLSGKFESVELAKPNVADYIADGSGTVRIMQTEDSADTGYLTGVTRYFYRTAGSRDWKPFSQVSADKSSIIPVAVDGKSNVAYAYEQKDGRAAIYSVSLDENRTKTLLASNDKVDMGGLLRLGHMGRVIGAEYITDKRETILFDAEFRALAGRLGKALPGLPLVQFAGASADESRLLLFAGSDTDPGRYYVYDKPTKRLMEIALARPDLEKARLSAVKPVTYPATDGTLVPAYLTLPSGSSGRGLPALVMPHGGPSARDEWGFDWLAQYYASKGFAVLQPNFRGSSGYGTSWYAENGFKSWRIAIGDVNDAGRWLVKEGIADPSKLAILGWSYGGYAALQSNVLDPDLFKAAVAIAPVVDLKLLKENSRDYTNFRIVADFVGAGERIQSGSPLQNITRIKAPVLMFSGDLDANVDISHGKAMSAALRKAGKPGELIIYKGLDHNLIDASARSDMLERSNNFLRQSLNLK